MKAKKMSDIDWENKPQQLLRKKAEHNALLGLFDLPENSPALALLEPRTNKSRTKSHLGSRNLKHLAHPGAKVRVTSQEFKRLAKLHAAAGRKPGPCWHEVLLREKAKRKEYRCAVCKRLLVVESQEEKL